MQHTRWSICLLGAVLVVGLLGCEPPPPPPPPAVIVPPVLPYPEFRAMKSAYLRANPDSRVGRVVAMLPNENRLSAGDLATNEFTAGDIVSIVDRDLNVVADGTVVYVDSNYVYVKYTAPVGGGGREPLVGDILIRAGKPDRANYR